MYFLVYSAVEFSGEGVVSISKHGIDTNIVMFDIIMPGLTAKMFTKRLAEVLHHSIKNSLLLCTFSKEST